MSSDYKVGDIVDITIKGVPVVVGPNGELAIQVENRDGALQNWLLPPQAAVERVAPAEWPPRAGDVWHDRDGNPWLAFTRGGEVALLHATSANSCITPEEVTGAHGPLALAYREDPA